MLCRGFDSHRGQKIFSLPRVVPCFPLLGLTPNGLFMGLSSTLIYTSELILCSTICVPSAMRHNIHMYPYFLFAAIHHLKSSPTFSVRPCSSVGRVTVDLFQMPKYRRTVLKQVNLRHSRGVNMFYFSGLSFRDTQRV